MFILVKALSVQKANITVENFDYYNPEDLIYNESAKEARVSSKLDTMGEITVKYYKDGSSEPISGAPTEVGSYKVKIDVEESDNYAGKTDITADDWKFEIKYLEVEQDLPYQISGHVYENNGTYWVKDTAQATDGQEGWQTFKEGSIEISLGKDNKYVVYEKLTDNVGHVTYISSDGIVVYSDSRGTH